MKKTFIMVAFLLILCSITACGQKRTEEPASAPALNKTPDVPTPVTYEIGDIILADGSAIKAAELTDLDANNLPVAVITGLRTDGTAFGIGVHRSSGPLQWAPSGTLGNSTNFSATVCTDSRAGDTDGSDNWSVICSADPQGTADTAANYPAFHFINSYAKTYQLPERYSSGWYMPSITEVCIVYDNRAAINTSLQTIYALDGSAAMDGLGTVWYWASSQADSEDDYVWFEHYFNGYAGTCPKDFDNLHVMAAHIF